MTVDPIGTIYSPFRQRKGMPIQPPGASGMKGRVEVFPRFTEGLKDLEGFSHIYLLYWFHQAGEYKPVVTPFMDTRARGLFATRAPNRPNPLGLSVVRLLAVDNNIVHVEGVDVLDGTPLIDIKPYVPHFDQPAGPVSVGWLDHSEDDVRQKQADERFH
jgi:tRNA-Thr(GGU) m(6)t(6)A37 methyltransferase TsaA